MHFPSRVIPKDFKKCYPQLPYLALDKFPDGHKRPLALFITLGSPEKNLNKQKVFSRYNNRTRFERGFHSFIISKRLTHVLYHLQNCQFVLKANYCLGIKFFGILAYKLDKIFSSCRIKRKIINSFLYPFLSKLNNIRTDTDIYKCNFKNTNERKYRAHTVLTAAFYSNKRHCGKYTSIISNFLC